MGKKKASAKPSFPKWVPKGHPHTWTTKQDAEYDAHMDQMSLEAWRAIDDRVYARKHSPDCPDCAVPVRADEPVVHVPEVWDWDGDVNTFAAEDWLPSGPIEEWSEGDAEDLLVALETLPKGLQDAVWEEIQMRSRELTDVYDAAQEARLQELWDKPTASLTDDEWEELEAALYGYDVETVASVTSIVKVDAECDCYGPGHPHQKYATHDQRCPTVGYKPPPKVCNCNGPGHAKQKYASHIFSCPVSPNYKPGATGWKKHDCEHDRDLFELDDGLSIFASAWRDVEDAQSNKVDVGVYLYSGWEPKVMASPGLELPWMPKVEMMTRGVYVDWPDFSVPKEGDVPVLDIVGWMLDEMKAGVKMETGCLGGHGRTGTMLAILLVAQGVTPPEAIDRVRKGHCKDAIESAKQVNFIGDFYLDWHGSEEWRDDEKLVARFDELSKPKYATTTYTPGKNASLTGKRWDNHTRSWVDKGPKGL